MEDIGCKKYQKPQKHSNVWKKKEAGVCLKTGTSGRSFRVNARWQGGGWPSKWFLRFGAYYFEVAVPFFPIVHHHLPPPQNNLKIFWGKRTVLREPPPNILLSTCWILFWGGWVPFTKMILHGFSVFEHIILKHLPPTSTSDSFSQVILGVAPSVFA